MGFEEPNPTPPKLSLLSLPNKPYDQNLEISTPPVKTLASVPFIWEEAPGRPRPTMANHHQAKSKVTRCLDLPPRLLNEANKVNNIPSPTTVLDGPYLGGDHRCHSLPRRRSLSFGSGGLSFSGLEKKKKERGGIFGPSRWGSFRRNSDNSKESSVVESVEVLSSGFEGYSKVKIAKVKSKYGFLTGFSSSSRSHLLANIYEGCKQLVPWRSRQRN